MYENQHYRFAFGHDGGLALAGCATPTVVTLQNGTQYLTKDLPTTKNASGFYEFVDIAGKHIKVKADDVATIKADN